MKIVTKIANIICLILGISAVCVSFYFTFFTEYFNTGNKFDDLYGLFGTWFSSVGFLIGSIYWFKHRLDNNV